MHAVSQKIYTLKHMPMNGRISHRHFALRQAEESENHLLETLRETPIGVSG